MVTEKLRKIATILYLCINGEMEPGSILLGDEPKSNMNPTLISTIVYFLLEPTKNSVQIFVFTHNCLLSHKPSIITEYTPEESPETKNVDFIRFNETPKMLFFIEVKSFRDYGNRTNKQCPTSRKKYLNNKKNLMFQQINWENALHGLLQMYRF